MQNKYITIKEAAKMLGVSALTLRNWDNSGKFLAGRHPISNYRVYTIEDIEKLISMMSPSKRPAKVKKLTIKHL